MSRITLLSERVLEVIRRGYATTLRDEEFNDIAVSIHRHQRQHCPAIARLGQRTGTLPVAESWREIPLVPTSLFASHTFATFDPAKAVRVFESSGTTRQTRGKHYYDDLTLYRASSLCGARWALGAGEFNVESLIEPRKNSSLACMAEWLKEEFSSGDSERRLIIGTAFSFVNLIDEGVREKLAAGSIVIETGGYKGLTREISRDELYSGIAKLYCLPAESILSEYGMCEISSPFWEQHGSAHGQPGARGFQIPPWVRVRLLDPETMSDVDPGGGTQGAGPSRFPQGVIAIYDLANAHSSIGILTSDVGSFQDGKLFLHGRLTGSDEKGCSLVVGHI